MVDDTKMTTQIAAALHHAFRVKCDETTYGVHLCFQRASTYSQSCICCIPEAHDQFLKKCCQVYCKNKSADLTTIAVEVLCNEKGSEDVPKHFEDFKKNVCPRFADSFNLSSLQYSATIKTLTDHLPRLKRGVVEKA